ncbi:GNAT family N-acetyltransferase [Pedococcus sp. KACC 23699]|uniref:GNAT family N-acetyltransferase n=1 Tax=Pedococcus sp. KACC 23699 TaxID=3149228 RepID=A0AAU7JT80_9MICO
MREPQARGAAATGEVPPVSIRPGTAADAAGIADLFWQVRTESTPRIPMIVHPRESILPFVEHVLLGQGEVWVAEADGRLVGFLALAEPDELGHLYIADDHTGRGLGSLFLEVAKERFPAGLQLWAFQSNTGALRFYERHGFVAVEWTDGDNEEGAPDVRMVWAPAR